METSSVEVQKHIQQSSLFTEWIFFWGIVLDIAVSIALVAAFAWQSNRGILILGFLIALLIVLWKQRFFNYSRRAFLDELTDQSTQRRLIPQDLQITRFHRLLVEVAVSNLLLLATTTIILLPGTPGGWLHDSILWSAILLYLPSAIGIFNAHRHFKRVAVLIEQENSIQQK